MIAGPNSEIKEVRLGHISKENVKRKMTEANLIKLTHAQKVFKTPVYKCEIKKKKYDLSYRLTGEGILSLFSW